MVAGECGLLGGAMRYLDVSGDVASGDAIASLVDARVLGIGLVR